MPKTAAPDWAAIRRRYEETDARAGDIAADGGVSKSELESVRKREKSIRQKPRGVPPGKKSSSIPPPILDNPPEPIPLAPVAAPPLKASAAARTPEPKPKKSKSKLATTTPAGRLRLLDRLVAAISLKLEQLERRMAQDLDKDPAAPDHGDAATATDHERETRAIGALIENLGKVTEMESAHTRSATGGKAATTADVAGEADRYRRELAERLAKIVGTAAT